MSYTAESSIRRISALHFLNFAARGLTLPFITLYLASLGFSGTEIGTVIGLGALAQLIFTPLSHWLADRGGKHRNLFYALQIGHVVSLAGMILPLGKVWVGGVNIIRDSANQSSISLLSQLSITRLDELARPIYGRVRGWGSFGWFVTSLISGGIIAVGGYRLLFILSALCNLAAFPLVRALPERTSSHPQSAPNGRRPQVFYWLLLSAALFQVGMNVAFSFGNLYFKRDLGASDALIGVIVAVAALAEIPSMMLYEHFLRRFSCQTLLIIGMVGQPLLWIILAYLSDSTPILWLMLVRGTFYTFHNISLTLLVSRLSHPANAATNQALAQVTAPGLAILLTGPLNGWIFDHLGPRLLLQLVAVLGLFAAGLVVIIRRPVAAREAEVQALTAAPVNL